MTKASEKAAAEAAAREQAMSSFGHAGTTDAGDVAQTSPLAHDSGSKDAEAAEADKKTITDAPPTPLTSAAPPPGDDKKRAKRARLGDREIKNAAYEKHGHQIDSSECTAFLQGVRFAEEQHGVNRED